jgi:hypothetical protein
MSTGSASPHGLARCMPGSRSREEGRRIVLRRCLLLASFLAAPAVAQAQFATFIPPKPKVSDSVAAAQAMVQKAKADSATATRIANMKRWVDSAAGLPPRSTAASDTVLAPGDTTRVLVATARNRTPAVATPSEPGPATRVETRRGAIAPATASSLPLLLLVGSLSLAVGVFLIAGTKPSRARNRA